MNNKKMFEQFESVIDIYDVKSRIVNSYYG